MDNIIEIFNNVKSYDIKLTKSYEKHKFAQNIDIPNIFFLYKMQAFYILEYNPNDYDNVTKLNSLFVNECGPEYHHNPGIIMKFLQLFKPTSVLDFSPNLKYADGLLGCLAYNIGNYIALSNNKPNTCEYDAHNKMIKLLPNNGNYILNNNGLNNFDFKGNNFDFIYVQNNDNIDSELFNSSIKKLVKIIQIGGHMIFHLSQSIKNTYIEQFIKMMMDLKNIYYQGCIFYKFNGYQPIFIYKKDTIIPEKLYNPKPKIRKIAEYIDNKKMIFNVISDNFIIGGTKTRAGLTYFQNLLTNNKDIKTMTYVGASNGYAQVAISYCLYLLKRSDIKLILYIQKEYKELQTLTYFYHSNTEYILIHDSMYKLSEMAKQYKETNGDTCFEIPFGFHFSEYEQLLYDNLSKYKDFLKGIKRMWLVVGSGTVLNVLQKLLPNTHFLGVQVGKKVYDDQIYDIKRFTLYVSSYKLFENYKHKVRYDTVQSYDAKIWEFVKEKKVGLDGDYIWNVAGSHNYL